MKFKQKAALAGLLDAILKNVIGRHKYFEENGKDVPEDERSWFLLDLIITIHGMKRFTNWSLHIPTTAHKEILLDYLEKCIPLADEKARVTKPVQEMEKGWAKTWKIIRLIPFLWSHGKKENALKKETMKSFVACSGQDQDTAGTSTPG